MDNMFDFFQGILNKSLEQHKKPKSKNKNNRWKYCVALEKAGYKATCESVEKSSDLIFIWNKASEKEIKVRLSFIEQQLWLNYLDKRSAKGNK